MPRVWRCMSVVDHELLLAREIRETVATRNVVHWCVIKYACIISIAWLSIQFGVRMSNQVCMWFSVQRRGEHWLPITFFPSKEERKQNIICMRRHMTENEGVTDLIKFVYLFSNTTTKTERKWNEYNESTDIQFWMQINRMYDKQRRRTLHSMTSQCNSCEVSRQIRDT